MTLKAKWNIKTRDKKGNEVKFSIGDEFKGIDKEEEKRLIKIGAAEEVNGSSLNSAKSNEEDKNKKKKD